MDKVMPHVSLFASAVRPALWLDLFKSLSDTTCRWEVIFSGPTKLKDIPDELLPLISLGKFKYIETGPIKPAQNYAVASRRCLGETISWSCDDAEYPLDILGKAYTYWKSKENEKLILSIQTKESGYKEKDGKLFNMNEHRFFAFDPESPAMAPMCLMSRKFFNELGGLDQRYVCGQYENDIVMRAYVKGATVEMFGGSDCFIDIDHLGKSIRIGESVCEETFLERPFAKGNYMDRQVLEASWTTFDEIEMFKRLDRGERPPSLRQVSKVQIDEFMPYPEKIPLDKSLNNKGVWL